jgi:hypothetical protein
MRALCPQFLLAFISPMKPMPMPSVGSGNRVTVRAMTDLSDDAHDKLQAALNYAAPDPDDYLGAEYRDACGAWFSRLTQGERWRLAMVIAAYERGSEADAEQLAVALPPAPRCPL